MAFKSFSGSSKSPQRGFLSSKQTKSGNAGFGFNASFAPTGPTKSDLEQHEKDMIQRVVYGDVGQGPGQSFDEKLGQELDNPQQPMTPGEAKFREDPFAYDKAKKAATESQRRFAPKSPRSGGHGSNSLSVGEETDRAIAYALEAPASRKVQTGKDSSGNPITTDTPWSHGEIMRNAQKMYKKADPNDPRWEDVRKKFTPKPETSKPEKPSLFSRIKNMGKSAYSKAEDMIYKGTPDNRKDPPTPGQARIFTNGNLPEPKGHKEGSYLKTNGVRTHQLKGGVWQPIQ